MTDPGNEDDVLESTCVGAEAVEARTKIRLGMQPVQKQPVAFWSPRYPSIELFKTFFVVGLKDNVAGLFLKVFCCFSFF